MMDPQRVSKSHDSSRQRMPQAMAALGYDGLQLTFTHGSSSQYPSSPLFLHPIQAKMILGGANDKYEQEADQVAQQVVNQLHTQSPQGSGQISPLQHGVSPEAEEEQQRKPEFSPIQRKTAPPVDDDEEVVSPELESSLHQAEAGGQTLPGHLQDPMEKSLNANLSGVRLHTDTQADRLNRAIQARAFTTGQDIFFRHGEYNPSSRAGQELLAHELTHVVQQQGMATPAHQARVQCMRLKGKNFELETDEIRKDEIPEQIRVNLEAAKEILAKAGEGLLWNPTTQTWEKAPWTGAEGKKLRKKARQKFEIVQSYEQQEIPKSKPIPSSSPDLSHAGAAGASRPAATPSMPQLPLPVSQYSDDPELAFLDDYEAFEKQVIEGQEVLSLLVPVLETGSADRSEREVRRQIRDIQKSSLTAESRIPEKPIPAIEHLIEVSENLRFQKGEIAEHLWSIPQGDFFRAR